MTLFFFSQKKLRVHRAVTVFQKINCPWGEAKMPCFRPHIWKYVLPLVCVINKTYQMVEVANIFNTLSDGRQKRFGRQAPKRNIFKATNANKFKVTSSKKAFPKRLARRKHFQNENSKKHSVLSTWKWFIGFSRFETFSVWVFESFFRCLHVSLKMIFWHLSPWKWFFGAC